MTTTQKEKLVEFVTSNHGVLFGREPCETTKEDLWNLIATELNEMGSVKDVPGWKRCYASLKCSVMRKAKDCTDGLCATELKVFNSSQTKPRQCKKGDIKSNQSASVTNSGSINSGTNSTVSQREQLVKLVSENYDALFGKLSNSANGASIKNIVWKSIAIQLNSVGPQKDVDGWIRCFNTLKGATKQKLTSIRQNKNRNGTQNIELDGIHSEVHKMYSLDVLDGCQEIDELGIDSGNVLSDQLVNNQLDSCKFGETTQSEEEMPTLNVEIDDEEIRVCVERLCVLHIS